ncbi:TMEM86B isoform 2 [Pongo abelii]|uniref:TMEM86B isoform 2 n=1 Tax=Pongo abelii TaxID=9601 RepID=A0A2J8R3B7_PONAB|nr:TMEM86B isoform 2 [Pongo abelii]
MPAVLYQRVPGKAIPGFTAQQTAPRCLQVAEPLHPLLLVYFCLWIPEDQLSWFAALIKCLPVSAGRGSCGSCPHSGGYTRLLQGALVCSAVGDACLIWPEAFLLAWPPLPPPTSSTSGPSLLSPAAWPAAAHHWPLALPHLCSSTLSRICPCPARLGDHGPPTVLPSPHHTVSPQEPVPKTD